MRFVNIKATTEFKNFIAQKKINNAFQGVNSSLLEKEFIERHAPLNGTFLGRIGRTGTKIHRLQVRYISLHRLGYVRRLGQDYKEELEVLVVTGAWSYCGSAKWRMSQGGKSELVVIEVLTEENKHQINCGKC